MSLFSNLRIGIRLGLSFGLILALLLIITLVAFSRMAELSKASERFVQEDVTSVLLGSDINVEAQAAAMRLLQLLSTVERDDRVALYTEMDSHNNKLDALIEALGKHYEGKDYAELTTVIERRSDYRDMFSETVDLIEYDAEVAAAQFQEDTRPALDALLQAIEQLVNKQQQMMQMDLQLSQKNSDHAINILIGLSVAALLLGAVLAVVVSRGIVEPVHEAVAVAQRIASGDLRLPPVSRRKDEIGDLSTAFYSMCEGLGRLISAIRDSSEQVHDSASSVVEPVRNVQTGSSQQSEAVSRIGQGINSFAQGSQQATVTAKEARHQAELARDLSVEGRQLIERATTEFDKISGTISHSASAVEELRERAVSVRNLVTTVREIADQTNLLALNAAIEAARAGESGRGFSVVADEVRNLAGRTGQVTSEINEVIDAIDRETQVAVERISNGRSEMNQGVELIGSMVEPLSELNEGAQASLEQLKMLEDTIEQQSVESAAIESEVNRIDEMASDNQQSVQRMSETTQDLGDLSKDLSSRVQEFRLA